MNASKSKTDEGRTQEKAVRDVAKKSKRKRIRSRNVRNQILNKVCIYFYLTDSISSFGTDRPNAWKIYIALFDIPANLYCSLFTLDICIFVKRSQKSSLPKGLKRKYTPSFYMLYLFIGRVFAERRKFTKKSATR